MVMSLQPVSRLHMRVGKLYRSWGGCPLHHSADRTVGFLPACRMPCAYCWPLKQDVMVALRVNPNGTVQYATVRVHEVRSKTEDRTLRVWERSE